MLKTESLLIGATPVTVTAVETGGVEIVERLAEEWRALCDGAANDEPFYRPEWIAAHVRAFEDSTKLVLVTARSGGRLTAVLPLAEERSWLDGLRAARLRSLSNFHSCRFDLLRSAGPEGATAVAAVWRCLKELPGWDFLQFDYVPEGGVLEQLLQAAAADDYPSGSRELWRTPYIPTTGWDGSWDFWIRKTGSNFRHSMRRIHRKFSAERPLAVRRVNTADAASLKCFYDVESSGWKGGEGTAISSRADTRRFYDEVAQAAERFGYLALYFLDLDGCTAAAHFGLHYRDRYLVPKCAYDERFREFAPGHLIINGILQDCAKEGAREFDFLGPAMEWKEKWTKVDRRHSALFVFRKGTYGSLLHKVHLRLRPAVGAVVRELRTHQE